MSMELNEDELKTLNLYITNQILDGEKWKYSAPCSSFASDAWNLVSPKKLQDRNYFISTPNTLADSIEKIK